MALPEHFNLVDEHGAVIGVGTADDRWVTLEYTDGQDSATAVMRPAEFEAVRGSLPQFQHINVVAT